MTNPRGRTSWERVFPAGRKMLAGLSSVFTDVALFGLDKGDYAGRKLYADFLDEAAGILSRPGLHSAAGHFRTAAEAWRELTLALLPDAVEPLRLTRELLLRRHHAFLARGNGALDEMKAIDAQLDALMVAAEADFPLSAAEVVAFRQRLAEQVLAVHDVEAGAVAVLKDAMS